MTGSISLYGTPWCEACVKAKSFIESTDPPSHGVDFYQIEVDEDFAGPLPTIWIGDAYLTGFNREKIAAELDNLYAAVRAEAAFQPEEPGVLPSQEPTAPTTAEIPSGPPPIDSQGAIVTLAVFAFLGWFAVKVVSGRIP